MSLRALKALALAERSDLSMERMFPALTETTCDCCGLTIVDEVALTAVCDAVRSYRDALVEKGERDRDAWAVAFAATDAAQAAAIGKPA